MCQKLFICVHISSTIKIIDMLQRLTGYYLRLKVALCSRVLVPNGSEA